MTSYQRLLSTKMCYAAADLRDYLMYFNANDLHLNYLSLTQSECIKHSIETSFDTLYLCFNTLSVFGNNYKVATIVYTLHCIWCGDDEDYDDMYNSYSDIMIKYLNVINSMLELDELWDCDFIEELCAKLDVLSDTLADLLDNESVREELL